MSKTVGTIETLSGEVTVITAEGESLPATANMAIGEDALVQTGDDGAMMIRFHDGSTMHIGPNAFSLVDKTVSENDELAVDETQAEVDSLKEILAESPDLSIFEETASGEEVAVGGSSLIVDSIVKHNDNGGDSDSSMLGQFASNKHTAPSDEDDDFGLVIDNTPVSVTLSDILTNDNTPDITGTVNDPDARILITVGDSDYTAINNGDGTWTLPVTEPITDGTTVITVVATDPAGNETTETAEITVDTTDPLISIDPVNTSDTTPTITGTTDDPTATIIVTVDGEELSATNNGDGTWSLPVNTPLSEGESLITVTATDPAGNTTTETTTITIDTIAPTLTIDTTLTSDATPTISGTVSEEAATIIVTIDGTSHDATNNGDGTWSLPVNTPLSDGDHEIVVEATDPAGNSSTETVSLTVDTTAPTLTIDALDTNDTTPTLTGTTDDADATLIVTVDGTDHTAINHGDGTWSLELTETLPEGTTPITVVATDAVGNQTTERADINIDTTYGDGGTDNTPTVTITEDSNDDGVINASELDGQIDVTVKVPAEAAVGDTIMITDGTTTTDIIVTPELITAGVVTTSFDAPAEGETITIDATVTDADGNSVSSSDSATIDTHFGETGDNGANQPTVTITEDTNHDGVINATELDGKIDVNITIPAEASAGDTIYVTDGSTTNIISVDAALIAAGSVDTSFDAPTTDGTVTITATVTDSDGNSVSDTQSVVVDTHYGTTGDDNANNTPTVTILADADDDGYINKTELNDAATLEVNIKVPAEAVTGDIISVTDGTTTHTVTVTDAVITAGSAVVTFDTPAEGETIMVTATVTDAQGNTVTSTDSATVDTIADNGDGTTPATLTLDPISDDLFINAQESGNLLTISGTSNVIGAEVIITMNGGSFATTTVQPDGSYEITVETTTMASFGDGSYTMQAKVITDSAGNIVYSDPQDVVLDTTFANVTIDAMTNDNGNSNDFITSDTSSNVISGTYEAESGTNTLIVKVDSSVYDTSNGLVVDTAAGTWELDLTGKITDVGLYDISAIVTDSAGNSTQVTQAVQTVDPSTGINLDPISANYINEAETLEGVIISGTSEQYGNPVTFTIDGNPIDLGLVNVQADGTFSVTVPPSTFIPYPDGTYVVEASVDDLVTGTPYTDTESVILDTSVTDDNGTGTGGDGSDASIILDAIGDGYVNQQEADNGLLVSGTTTAVAGTAISFTVTTTAGSYQITETSNNLPITANPDGTFSAFIKLDDLSGVDNTEITITAEVVADEAGNIASSTPVTATVDLSAGTLTSDTAPTPVLESALENGSAPSLNDRTTSGNLFGNDTNVGNSTIDSVTANGISATPLSDNSDILSLTTESGTILIAVNDTNYNGTDYVAGDYLYTLENLSAATTDVISYSVIDAAGNVSNTADLTINIVDGAPVAYDNVDTIIALSGNTTAGNVITDEYAGQVDTLDGATTLTAVTYDGTQYSFVGDTLSINAQYGEITFQQDGSYEYVYSGPDPVQTGGNTVDLWDNIGVYAYQDDSYLNNGVLDATTLASHTSDVSENSLGLGVADSGWFSSDSINGDDALVLEFADNISEVKLHINDTSFFDFFAGTTVTIYDADGNVLDTQGNTHFISFFGSADDTYQIDMGDVDFKYVVIESTSKVYVDEVSYTPAVTTTTDITETFTYEITDMDGDTSSANLIIDGNNNTITYDSNALLIDGGLGMDTLLVAANDDLDFSGIDNLRNMEIIDLSVGDHQVLNLEVADILNMTDGDNVLTIYGDNGDSVAKPVGSSETWTQTATGVDDGNGHTVDVYSVSDGSNTVTVNIEQEIIVS